MGSKNLALKYTEESEYSIKSRIFKISDINILPYFIEYVKKQILLKIHILEMALMINALLIITNKYTCIKVICT